VRDKVAVVVGGSSGIGRTLAVGLAQAGAHVVASARRVEMGEAVAAGIEALGRKTIRCPCDVTDRESLEKLLEETLRALGRVDVLVNCAGFNQRTPTMRGRPVMPIRTMRR
jgi:NAD(P)-dependent dehydrogenase (short-subunit alcohol dehydrogenase family)